MLNEEQIEKFLYEYTNRQDEFNLSVIRIIADRLSKLADFDTVSSLNSLSIIQEDTSNINSEYNRYKKDQKKRIRDDFWLLAEYIYGEALIYYETQLALQQNRELSETINSQIIEAQERFDSLVRNPVITMRDLSNPGTLRNFSLDEAYRSVINEATSYRGLSEELRNVALQRTESQLFDSGVRYMADNNSVSANNAVRMNILDSMRNLINNMQDVMGKQFGADGVELSAHVYPAPDHAPAQGHIYTLENMDNMQSGMDFEDVDGHSYVGFERQIGTWNCRHYFMRIKIGKSKPTYTQEQLDKILEENEIGYTTPDGRHYTLYECTQIQRGYERKIRNAKENYLFAKSLKDRSKMMQNRNRVGRLTTQYKQFSNACGIPAKLERIRVKDY